MNDAVRSERHGRVLVLRLNRPEAMNALSTEILTGLRDGIRDARGDSDVRAVAILGSPGAFCAGADLVEAGGLLREGGAGFREWLLLWRETFDSFEEFPGPVVAAVDGPALAGGLEMALACDLIVASDRAKLGDVHARYGLVPGGGGSQRLVDAVGTRFARWLMYTGEMVSAVRAQEMGLVQQVFGAENFEDDVLAFLSRIADRSAPSTRFMKAMSRSRLVTREGLDLELEEASRVVNGADALEGLAAFVERREPRFE